MNDIKKCWYYYKKYGQINNEEYEQFSPPRIETKNTEKLNITEDKTTKQILTQEDKMKADVIKKAMWENNTTLPSKTGEKFRK